LTLEGKRSLNQDEFDILSHLTGRIQKQVDRVLGPDEGMAYTSEFTGGKNFILRVPTGIANTNEVRSLIGWIELFTLEETPQPMPSVAAAFPLGNPGFAP
jgi:hypothetical protein